MRAPIKLNRAGWPRWLRPRFLSVEDPAALARSVSLTAEQFSARLSVLKFGSTFKTTQAGRHARSNALLAEIFKGQRPTVLDIGASDGSTSLDLIRALGRDFLHYFATDYNISVQYAPGPDGTTFFRDDKGQFILRSGRRLVVYADVAGALPPFGFIARRLLAEANRLSGWKELMLVQPALADLASRDSRVRIRRHDVFGEWTGPTPDLIKVANVLNRAYFSESEIVEGLGIQARQLRQGGRLLLLDNRGPREQFSILLKDGERLLVEHECNGGCEVTSLIAG